MLRQALHVAVCVAIALTAATARAQAAAGGERHEKYPWRTYRISTRWVRTLHITKIEVDDASGSTTYDCSVDVTTSGSASPYYVGTSTAPGFKYVLGATTRAGVRVAPVPMRFSVPGRLSIAVGHTSCADGSPPPVDCAGTYSFPIQVAQFAQVRGAAVVDGKPITAWTFGYRPLVPRGWLPSRVPPSCHDPDYSSLLEDAFDLVAAGGFAGPYASGIPMNVTRARLLADRKFTATLVQDHWGASYERGVGTMQTWASLTPVAS